MMYIMIMVLVRASPFVSLIDQTVRVSVAGLLERQKVTLRAKLTGDKGERFESSAHYIADEHGTVSVSSQPSVGGSYTGIEPMGLLWSMKLSPGQKKGIRLLKRDVTKPYVVSVDVFGGHLRLGGENEGVGEPISSGTFEKWYMNDRVKRFPVREGRIRGTLFLPPGDGPFPGVIDWFGTMGGLIEMKASLLASKGFAALSLAYFNYEDLPKDSKSVESEYFEEAAEWMVSQPKISSDGVAVMSVSGGSQYALLLAIRRPDLVKAVISISPLNFLFLPFGMRGEHRYTFSDFLDFINSQQSKDGAVITRKFFIEGAKVLGDDSTLLIPVEKLQCPVLFIYGDDDLNTGSEVMVKKMAERMQKHGKGHLCTVQGYPGAGHLIEPPYTPHCAFSFMKLGSQYTYFAWGGEPKAHADAQEDSWLKILKFFSNQLSKNLTRHL